MNLLKAARYPFRSPLRLFSIALTQSIFLWLLPSILELSEQYPFDWGALAVASTGFLILFVNAIWLHNTVTVSLRRLYSGQSSMPSLNRAHFYVHSFRTSVSSLILFVYLVLFVASTQILPLLLRQYEFLWSERQAIGVLARDALVMVLVAAITLIYVIGLARHATQGRSGFFAALKANVGLLLNNKRTTLTYVLLQLALLCIAAIVHYAGAEIGYEMRPRGLGSNFDDARTLAWDAFSVLISFCGYLYFWFASVHLLAQYAMKVGLAPDRATYRGKADAI